MPLNQPTQDSNPDNQPPKIPLKERAFELAKTAYEKAIEIGKPLLKKGGEHALEGSKIAIEKIAEGTRQAAIANKPYMGVEALGFTAGLGAGMGARALDDHVVAPIEDFIDTTFNSSDEQNTQDNPTNTPENNGEAKSSRQYQQWVSEKARSRRKRHNYAYIMNRGAAAPSSLRSDKTRLEYATEAFSEADLPKYLQEFAPFIAFQESGYKLNADSGKALGPWQFTKPTGRNYDLVGRGYDHRTNFRKSTNAAVKFLEDAYKKLKENPHYKMLVDRYKLQENGMNSLIGPIVINSYNCGPGHIKHALKYMATDNSIRPQLDRLAANGGGQGLYTWFKTDYRGNYRKWQRPKYKSGDYYGTHGAGYVYHIAAYKQLHDQDMARNPQSAPVPPGHTARSTDNPAPTINKTTQAPHQPISAITGAIAGATLAAAATWKLVVKPQQEKKPDQTDKTIMSRRGFLKLGAATTAGAVGGAIGSQLNAVETATKVAATTLDFVRKSELQHLDESQMRAEQANLLYVHLQMQKSTTLDLSKLPPSSNKNGLIKNPSYIFNQYMGDTSFELSQQTGESKYLQFADYYYQRACKLAKEQQQGKHQLPTGGQEKITKRIAYCTKSLAIVSAEFSE